MRMSLPEKALGVLLPCLALTLFLHGCKQPTSLNDLFQPRAPKKEIVQAEEPAPAPDPDCDLRSLSVRDRDAHHPAWGKIWGLCPASPVSGYNYAYELMRNGDTLKAAEVASQAAARHPDFEPLQQLSMRLNNPYGYVGILADRQLQQWLAVKSRHQFTRQPPVKRTPPPLPKLVKGEFETSAEFKGRVDKAKQERAAQLQQIERDYEAEVKVFNDAVVKHNQAVAREREERAAAVPAMRAKYLEQALADVLGAPELKDPVYDADSGKFHARLVSSNGLLQENVIVTVPRKGGQARAFKEGAAQARVSVPYVVRDGKLVRGAPQVGLNGHAYAAMFTDETFSPVVMTAMADVKVQPGTTISTMTAKKLDMSSVRNEDAQYFGDALKTQDDPKLAALRQEQAENARMIREARQEEARKAEAARIQEEIRRQQQELAAMGGTEGRKYEGLTEKTHWTFRPARTPASHTVAVVIGNRDYQKGIPVVPYAYNDAKAVRQFLTTGLGIAPENVLYHQDATKGEMEGVFRRTLRNRVEAGRTDVIVYFSGHGMPMDSKALLLPTDASPNTADITGYSRDTMLAQLDALQARSVTVILDACFSGTDKEGDALIQGKPVFKRPTAAHVSANTVLITAGRSNQIARLDDEAGMSLMTYHLLLGLSGEADADHDGAVSVAELRPYLEKSVSRTARLEFDSDQQPEVLGPVTHVLVAY